MNIICQKHNFILCIIGTFLTDKDAKIDIIAQSSLKLTYVKNSVYLYNRKKYIPYCISILFLSSKHT